MRRLPCNALKSACRSVALSVGVSTMLAPVGKLNHKLLQGLNFYTQLLEAWETKCSARLSLSKDLFGSRTRQVRPISTEAVSQMTL